MSNATAVSTWENMFFGTQTTALVVWHCNDLVELCLNRLLYKRMKYCLMGLNELKSHSLFERSTSILSNVTCLTKVFSEKCWIQVSETGFSNYGWNLLNIMWTESISWVWLDQAPHSIIMGLLKGTKILAQLPFPMTSFEGWHINAS